MWWIALIALAVIAFFVVKAMQSGKAQQHEHDQSGGHGHDESQNEPQIEPQNEPQNDPTSGAHATADVSNNPTGARTAAVAAASAGVAAVASTISGNSESANLATSRALNSGDVTGDIREMLKILNLASPDAARLGISGDQLMALRQGTDSAYPDSNALGDVAAKLRSMLS